MMDWKSPGVKITKRKGEWQFANDNRDVFLRRGIWTQRDSCLARIFNNDETRFLKFKRYKVELASNWTYIEDIKVNPGKSKDLSAPFGIGKTDYVLSGLEWKDKDPDPDDRGGLTPGERATKDTATWIQDNMVWIIVGVVSLLIFYAVMTRT